MDRDGPIDLLRERQLREYRLRAAEAHEAAWEFWTARGEADRAAREYALARMCRERRSTLGVRQRFERLLAERGNHPPPAT